MATWFTNAFNILIHLDTQLKAIALSYGAWVYLLLFLVIFLETGLVIFPFLPGDSLLFSAGILAANHLVNIHGLFVLLCLAAVLGDNLNYVIGRTLGHRFFSAQSKWWFNESHFRKTAHFYQEHGPKSLIIARFIPIVRTFIPFFAGVTQMNYLRYVSFDVMGGLLWTGSLLYCGYFLGTVAWVSQHMSLIVLFIILISLMPSLLTGLRHYTEKRNSKCSG